MAQGNNDDKLPMEFKEKVNAAADVIIGILKDLYFEKVQVNSKILSERMMQNDSIKSLCSDKGDKDVHIEKEIVEAVLDKLSGLLPSSNKEFDELKEQIHTTASLKDPAKWINAAAEIIKKHIDSISERSKELEDLLQKAMQYISDIEG